MLNVVMLNVGFYFIVMLNVFMLNVVMLNVVAPLKYVNVFLSLAQITNASIL